MTKSSLILPLNRPQYVALPEGFLSAIAWGGYQNLPKIDGATQALKFRGVSSLGKSLKVVFTDPSRPDDAELGKVFRKNLENLGINIAEDGAPLAEAVANSILGIQPQGGKTIPASPMTPNLALLQNLEAISGSANPVGLAEILETIFSLGDTSTSKDTVASLWRNAMEVRLTTSTLLNTIDSALFETLTVFSDLKEKPRQQKAVFSGWADSLENSPFTWFNKSWRTITSESWVQTLPPRVWTDWATTVLRMGYGLAYLWETAWYVSIARTVIGGYSGKPKQIVSRMDQILPWRKLDAGTEVRDVNSKIISRAESSLRIREAIEAWSSKQTSEFDSMEDEIEALSKDTEVLKKFSDALRPMNASDPTQRLREAIFYSLQTRDEEDFFGLLSKRGKYKLPEPGIEWIAAMSSLAIGEPGRKSDLATIKSHLNEAGLEPNLDELTKLLEVAGLARSSADSDQGMVVEAAF